MVVEAVPLYRDVLGLGEIAACSGGGGDRLAILRAQPEGFGTVG